MSLSTTTGGATLTVPCVTWLWSAPAGGTETSRSAADSRPWPMWELALLTLTVVHSQGKHFHQLYVLLLTKNLKVVNTKFSIFSRNDKAYFTIILMSTPFLERLIIQFDVTKSGFIRRAQSRHNVKEDSGPLSFASCQIEAFCLSCH